MGLLVGLVMWAAILALRMRRASDCDAEAGPGFAPRLDVTGTKEVWSWNSFSSSVYDDARRRAGRGYRQRDGWDGVCAGRATASAWRPHGPSSTTGRDFV